MCSYLVHTIPIPIYARLSICSAIDFHFCSRPFCCAATDSTRNSSLVVNCEPIIGVTPAVEISVVHIFFARKIARSTLLLMLNSIHLFHSLAPIWKERNIVDYDAEINSSGTMPFHWLSHEGGNNVGISTQAAESSLS